ncbi:MAG: MFS transporter [Halieaceae bacterium]|jgi:MFS family permease|nr:MFS transporter [Halieaceae bacterium]
MDAAPYTVRQANTALTLLLLAYVLSFIDRNVMSVLIGPIRQDFAISDFQYSLLHGFAFSMFYITLGLPIARMADRSSRIRIISGGIVLWSLMTCLCGYARNFASLFLARMGVGVGEAALSPAAFSILADVFPPHKLPRATAIYSLGITLGGGLAYILGSVVFDYFASLDLSAWRLLKDVRPWQLTFLAVGVPGFLVALCLRLLPEPPRTGGGAVTVAVPEQRSLAEVLGYFRQHWRVYVGVIGSMALMSVLGYGVMAWYPELLIRIYEADRSTAGSQFGLIFIISGSAGALLGGWLCSTMIARGILDAPVRIIFGVCFLWAVPAALAPLSGSADRALLMAWPIIFFLNAYFGIGVSAVALVTPANMRAQASAVLLFFTNLFGLAFGPSAVAILTDFVYADDAALDASLTTLPFLVLPPAALLALLAMRPYRELATSLANRD